jgi:hypothetical protein
MAAAVAADDFETAASLRDAIQEAEAVAAPEASSRLRRQAEGAMGLGTDQPKHQRPAGWTPPKRPDPLTTNTRPRRGGR